MSEPARSQPELRLVEHPEVERLKAETVRLRRMLDAMQVDLENAETELKGKRRQISALKTEIKRLKEKKWKDARDSENYETVYRIWCFHRDQVRPKNLKMGLETFEAVRDRLAESVSGSDEPAFSPRYICEAILGAKYEAYTDPRGKRHDSLALICRDADKLQDFHERYERHKARSERDSSA